MKKNSKGLYTTTITYNGKRYYIRAKTEKELWQRAAKRHEELESGLIVANASTTVSRWAEQWLETYKKNNVRQGAYERYVSIIRRHLIAHMGDVQMKNVRPVHLQTIINAMSGMSADTVKKAIQTFFAVFDKARANGIILQNPAADLEMPKVARSITRRAITDGERDHILAVAKTHPAGLWVKTMLYCGLRPEETVPLQWCHVLLDQSPPMLRIECAAEARTGEIKPPKSEAGIRSIPIPAPFAGELRTAKSNAKPFDFLFCRKNGKCHSATTLRSLWVDFKECLDISMGAKFKMVEHTSKHTVNANKFKRVITISVVAKDLVPYCLRHTYGTDLQAAGVPINVARELMGHSDISVTAKVYTHSSTTALSSAAATIDTYHGATSGATSNVPKRDENVNKKVIKPRAHKEIS